MLELLKPGDNVMADKGFLIENILPEGDYQKYSMATVNLKMPARLHLHVPQRIPCSISSLYTFFAYVHVHDIFTPTGITINVPPGLWGKEQLTETEAKESRKISKGRIHVERER